MKKTFKLFTIMIMILSLSLSLKVPAKVEAKTISPVSPEISLLSRKDNVFTYSLTENNEKITITFDIETDIVLVNNKSYSIETYNKAVEDQANDSSKESLAFYLKVYPETTHLISENNDLLAITSSSAPPTSGYGTEYKAYSIKKINWAFALTSGAIMGVATYMTAGDVEAAKRITNAVIGAAVSAGLAALGDVFNNNIYTQYYQSQHLTVYGAVRERRRTYTVVERNTYWGTYSGYTYFWSIKPY